MPEASGRIIRRIALSSPASESLIPVGPMNFAIWVGYKQSDLPADTFADTLQQILQSLISTGLIGQLNG